MEELQKQQQHQPQQASQELYCKPDFRKYYHS